ncbi:TNF receptor-associated factor 5-like [Sinocyclocheilus rhinocerous]|uniref:TNF receptor-associated factor 5-like n=1 Tax=Sinocyclocheilus rhinocerous TaxID=307959 RepID=UPI0007BA32CA|nr:PREDICTED: TNF receptor-associated factor 5-like [Sinocyclocheilus rhinocerous]
MAAEENECVSRQDSELMRAWELEAILTNRTLRFVLRLEQQFVCPSCGGMVLNPHQTGCGHIFCARCVRAYIKNGGSSKCPLDSIPIKSEEIFQDNCCKRELLNLEVYCTNAPDCAQRVTLCNLQGHLKACQYERLRCSNSGCNDTVLRKNLLDHQRKVCSFRLESCHHCRQPFLASHLQAHQKTSCPEIQDPCPNKCPQMIRRHKLQAHADECLEVETDCLYKNYGCTFRDKRGKVQVHENTEFSSHVRLVLESNTKLETQVEQLQQDMLVQQGALKDKSFVVSNLDRDITLCDSTLTTLQLQAHADECLEVETDCLYKNYGCTFRDKRGKVQVHENTEFSSHVRLVLESNTKLETQVEQLQQDMLVQQGALKDKSFVVSNLDRDITLCDSTLTTLQRSVEEQRVRICSVQRELRDLRGVLGSELSEELPSLRASLDSLRQQVAVTESLREHLGALEQTCQRHTRLLDIHVEQLQCNEQRFHQLVSTSYDGKLIWKVRDYWHRKEAGTLLNSTPLYTSRSGYKLSVRACRSGYKLSVRAYLGGDSSGRGTHLSLYITIMRGDFDSLLSWPFRQNITLTLLDQSGSRNHQSNTFTPDTNSDSFHRPTSDANVATGFPRFILHGDLEAPRNAVYVRDDTLFIKVKVDTTGLEDL